MSQPIAIAELTSGDRRALAKAITLVESRSANDRDQADALLDSALPHSGGAIRLGISGVPGVGKSTFIEAFGMKIIAEGKRVAVLAIDPSSPVSGGSILGDRTRMEQLSSHDMAFIRPSPTGGTLGGVARRTQEAILLCEAAGYDVVLVETVGVGQSEALAAQMVDLFITLQLPNAGDELQGIKKGILELADIIAVTKADGKLAPFAKLAATQLEQALALTRSSENMPPIILTSAVERRGVDEVWQAASELFSVRSQSKEIEEKRQRQRAQWFDAELTQALHEALLTNSKHRELLAAAERRAVSGTESAGHAARKLVSELIE